MNTNPVRDLTIRGYKSIKELKKFKLENLNVLIGANGAGKSNFISLFKFLNQIAEGRLQIYVQKSGGANNFLYHGNKITNSIEIELNFGRNGYWCKLTPTDNDSLLFEGEGCSFLGGGYSQPYTVSIFYDGKESGLERHNTKRVVTHVLSSILSWRVYHFHDTSDTAPMKRTCELSDNERLRPDASNLAAYLYLLKNKYIKDYNNIVSTIRMVAPFFDDFILRPSNLNSDKIQLEWKHKISDDYFNAASLSDGSLRFICLTTLLMQPVENLPATILLDEPELGLHPLAITVLANLLRVVANRTQLIVSTQSVTLINHLKPENIIVVDRDRDQSVFRRLTKEEMVHWIDDFGLGDLWEKNIFGGRP